MSTNARTTQALVPIKVKRVTIEPSYLILLAESQFRKTSALESVIENPKEALKVKTKTAVDPFRPFEDDLCGTRIQYIIEYRANFEL